jgi:hypothetical protein
MSLHLLLYVTYFQCFFQGKDDHKCVTHLLTPINKKFELFWLGDANFLLRPELGAVRLHAVLLRQHVGLLPVVQLRQQRPAG